MGMVRVQQHDSLGYAKVDGFCIYAAFAPIDDNFAYIKVGISTTPLARIYTIHCNNAEPIDAALWAHVGSKAAALSVEKRIHRQLAAYKTRGEWLRMKLDDPQQKQIFHATCRASFALATGRKIEWRKVTIEQVRKTLGIDRLQ